MKTLLSVAAIGTALMLSAAGIAPASAASANKMPAVKETEASNVTDFSARRRHHHAHRRHWHHGPRYGYAPRYYARPYAYRPYGAYGSPYGYGPGPAIGLSFGFGPRW